jgi:hypothetical protein
MMVMIFFDIRLSCNAPAGLTAQTHTPQQVQLQSLV